MLPLFSITVLSVLLLVACGGSESTQAPGPTLTPDTTSAPTQATAQATATLAATLKPSQPTLTPVQTPTRSPTATLSPEEEQFSHFEIVTLLPRDGIRAIVNPRFMTTEQARNEYAERELVLGVSINGDNRAYSIPFLSGREIVNDVVGGVPVAVTW